LKHKHIQHAGGGGKTEVGSSHGEKKITRRKKGGRKRGIIGRTVQEVWGWDSSSGTGRMYMAI